MTSKTLPLNYIHKLFLLRRTLSSIVLFPTQVSNIHWDWETLFHVTIHMMYSSYIGKHIWYIVYC